MDVIGLAILAILMMLTIFWVWVLVDATRRPEGQFRAAGLSKGSWVVRLVLFSWVAGIVYLVVARPKLDEAPAFPARMPSPSPQEPMPLRKRDWGDPWQAEP